MSAVTPLPTAPADDEVDVYRVEHCSNGCGPYNPRGEAPFVWEMVDAHGNDPERPGPFALDEFPDMFDLTTEYIFGFHTMALLSAWFGGWEAELNECGYRIAVYRVPASAVVQGRTQCVFRLDRARRRATQSLA
ncbi:hypothetical protein [Arthrobacter phage SWEP2]|uniref:Uncharacterized protein n=1 Tax=Arthrobacter phage SWEP2 TaxID=2945958 RepID=A0A9E7SGR4_9CAUD|nr:hypothetical protein [Arthrobacter phage SWEP2]